jgi:TonB-dependent SusC/RagA subfamily outer membrane receptor
MQRTRCHILPVLLILLVIAPALGAQQITGRVMSGQPGEPLAAVQVFIAGSGIGALTQQNGRFLLLNVPAGTHTVSAERIGYRAVTATVQVAAGETVVQDFTLAEQALGLDEIVVTGTPGGTQRRAIGNTVTSVDVSDVTRNVGGASVQNILIGRSPGVQLAASASMVGAGSDIQIRGVGTFTLGRNPLIFVDGVRVNNDARAGPETGIGRTVNIFNDFNPSDIESIEVIKGPGAATLYGTEASAGVIQIITKRGAEGAPQFEASIRQGIQYIRDPQSRLGTQWTCKDRFAPPCSEESGSLVPYLAYDRANEILDIGTAACASSLEDPQCWNQYWTKGPASENKWPQDRVFQNGNSQSSHRGVTGGTTARRYFLQSS